MRHGNHASRLVVVVAGSGQSCLFAGCSRPKKEGVRAIAGHPRRFHGSDAAIATAKREERIEAHPPHIGLPAAVHATIEVTDRVVVERAVNHLEAELRQGVGEG